MSRLDPPKSAAGENPPVAPDDHGLELHRRAREKARRRRPCALGDQRGQVKARDLSEFEGVQRAVGACDRLGKRRRTARASDALAERRKVDGAALRMQIQIALERAWSSSPDLPRGSGARRDAGAGTSTGRRQSRPCRSARDRAGRKARGWRPQRCPRSRRRCGCNRLRARHPPRGGSSGSRRNRNRG